MNASKGKKAASHEDKRRKKIRTRMKFRALVRRVIQNLYWLEDEQIERDVSGNNLFLNVQQLTKKKKQSLLTLKEKAILMKDKNYRTEEEKTILAKVIGGLPCFRRYPNYVKNQLAAVTYFKFYGPNRVIVKQDDDGTAMYFILVGEVAVTQTYYDKLLKENVTLKLGTMLPGSGFGEVSLLHGIKRTATITTMVECEVLEIKKEDFDIILKATVMAEWDEIKRCMSIFDYFNNWNEVAVRECCILGKKRTFEPGQVILGNQESKTDFVHFVVSGSVNVIERLAVRWRLRNGKKFFKLVDKLDEDFQLLGFKYGIKADGDPSSVQILAEETLTLSEENSDDKRNGQKIMSDGKIETLSLEEKMKKMKTLKNIQFKFIKVCTYNKLGCFNLGENISNRVFVAKEATECLLIPMYWLFQPQQNKSNIWNRIQQYLNQRIPTTEKIFRDFVEERKWVAYRRALFDSIHRQVSRGSQNSIINVPYSLRMQEDVDNS